MSHYQAQKAYKELPSDQGSYPWPNHSLNHWLKLVYLVKKVLKI